MKEGETEENIRKGHANGEKSELPITALQREVLLVTAGAAAETDEQRLKMYVPYIIYFPKSTG